MKHEHFACKPTCKGTLSKLVKKLQVKLPACT